MENTKIWVGSLAAYNGGELRGEWIELPLPNEELSDRIRHILQDDEEFDIFDTDITSDALRDLASRTSVGHLNKMVEEYEALDTWEKDVFEAIVEVHGMDVEEAFQIIANGDYIALTDVEDVNGLGHAYIDEGLFGHHIPEELDRYVCRTSLGEDLTHEGWEIDAERKIAFLLTK